jgi:hypothetical protein
MRCNTCRDRFSERFDARLSAGDAAAFDAHLAACGACASEYAAFRRVFDAVRALPARRPPPFRRPAELPGVRPPFVAAPTRAPRFRTPLRAAAAILVAAGLGLSHGMVFRYGKEVAGEDPGRITSAAENATLVNSFTLPSKLRDHVEAADLFVRTAAQMPGEMGVRGRELLAADFARLDLPRLTDELRRTTLVHEADHGPLIRAYFENLARLCDRLEGEFRTGDGLDGIRDAVTTSPVTRDLAALRPVVMHFGTGGTFKGRPHSESLRRDERALFESRDARLGGDLYAAVDGYRRFGAKGEFRGSKLAPLADYLLAESYARSGNYGQLPALLQNLEQRGGAVLPNDNLASLGVVLGVANGGVAAGRREIVLVGRQPPMQLRMVAMTPDGRPQFVADGTWEAPDNALDYLDERGLTIRCFTYGVRPAFEIVKDGVALPTDTYPGLFAAVRLLINRPDLDGSLLSPTEYDEKFPPRKPVVR